MKFRTKAHWFLRTRRIRVGPQGKPGIVWFHYWQWAPSIDYRKGV
jgi:hypothetical protein